MKRPSFQFYTGDWLSDSKLRRCSPAARGVWVDMLCVLHDSDDAYGLLRWPLKEILRTIGATPAHAKELIDKGVLRGSDAALSEPFVYVPKKSGRRQGDPVVLLEPQPGPIWFSARMVRDEYIRTVRGDGSRYGIDTEDQPEGGTKAPPEDAPKPPLRRAQGDGSSTSSSSSSSPSGEENPPTPESGESDGFARFWSAWPGGEGSRKGGRPKCLEAWRKGKLERHADEILAHVETMKASPGWRKDGGQFVPAPLVYLNGRRWDGAETGDPSDSLFAGSI